MRNTLLLLFCLCFFACKKTSKPTGPQNPKYNIPMVIDITGLKDTTMMQTDTLILPISVDLLSGTPVPMSVGVMNVPDSMTVMADPQVDTPGYTGEIRVISKYVDTGTYTIQLRATAIDLQKDFYFQVHVVQNPYNYAIPLVGQYTENGNCTTSGTIDNQVAISLVPGVFNKVYIKGIWNGGNSFIVTADIDPSNQTILIPQQSVAGQSFSGGGTYSTNQVEINYSVTGLTVSENCSVTLTR